jgi:ABC-2 type transport system ATP-binding protein
LLRSTNPRLPKSDSALEVDGLWKRYGRRAPWILQDVSFQVPRGAVTAVIGPNGAGKSTLIRTWMGFERPDRGSARVAGIDPSRRESLALSQIGYVPQASSLYRRLTVGDHLRMATAYRRDFRTTVAVRYLDQLRIGLRSKTGSLSGGQQAQLALIIALATEAPILLLDEPMASLDPLARREFLGLLKSAARDGQRTVFMSSHVVSDVSAACDCVVILGGGRLLLADEVGSALGAHRVVAQVSMPPAGDVVGTFQDIDGNSRYLIHTTLPVGSPSTLEEIVLGYLASNPAWDRADWPTPR